MAREKFIQKRFNGSSLAIIDAANKILNEYAAEGLRLTLRGLYYQFVARGIFEENTLQKYKQLGSILSDARQAGLVDWNMLEDNIRSLSAISTWDQPKSIMDDAAEWYREDLWANQTHRPEVWIEKDAIAGIVRKACRELRVPYFALRGYCSQTAMYEAGKRLESYLQAGQTPIIFHFGDHDPSGTDMSRDNYARVQLFARDHMGISFERLALNREQIDRYKPPPQWAKDSDSRTQQYKAEHGKQCWELDALEPRVIDRLIREAVEPLIDWVAWERDLKRETKNRASVAATARSWMTAPHEHELG
jgi:hypothetical protein